MLNCDLDSKSNMAPSCQLPDCWKSVCFMSTGLLYIVPISNSPKNNMLSMNYIEYIPKNLHLTNILPFQLILYLNIQDGLEMSFFCTAGKSREKALERNLTHRPYSNQNSNIFFLIIYGILSQTLLNLCKDSIEMILPSILN